MAGVLTKCARFVVRSGLVQQEVSAPLASSVQHTRNCTYKCYFVIADIFYWKL